MYESLLMYEIVQNLYKKCIKTIKNCTNIVKSVQICLQNCTKIYKNYSKIVQWYRSRQKWLISYSKYHRSYPDGNREFIRIDFPRVKTSIYNQIIDFDMIKFNQFDSFTKYRGLQIIPRYKINLGGIPRIFLIFDLQHENGHFRQKSWKSQAE